MHNFNKRSGNPGCTLLLRYVFMKLTIRKLIVVAIFIFYMAIGHKAFFFLFGNAWWLDSSLDLLRFALYVLLVGCLVAIVLSAVPAFIWPQNIWIWIIAYPYKTLWFGLMVVFSVIVTGNTKDVVPAIIWASIGICMAGSSYVGAKLGSKAALKKRTEIT
jgi:hypothetical protein